jgi:UDP-2,3-diacylglucosamine pyrophosphatase LpxH
MSVRGSLKRVIKYAPVIICNDTSKFVFFSDVHRGDNSWADDFAHNQTIYFHALSYYTRQGFTYFELGDGDELWENRRFGAIRSAHSDVFWLMRKLYRRNRLYILYGNHDKVRKYKRTVEKTLYRYYDERSKKVKSLFPGISIYEGLILKYMDIRHTILLVHGNQGDSINDGLWWFGRWFHKYFWKPLQLISVHDPTRPAENYRKASRYERKYIRWARQNKIMIIAGHTHRPRFPEEGEPAFFNDGSCVHPRCITGIEIEKGEITLMKWSMAVKGNGDLSIKRSLLAGPRKLRSIFPIS